jgi:methylenetetrahydrofolate--tRNA-(uracil-5-)-methyltransferase
MESAASGLIAGRNAARRALDKPPLLLPEETMIGALSHYISDPSVELFQPMGANFGILPPLDRRIRDKKERYAALAERSLLAMEQIVQRKESES